MSEIDETVATDTETKMVHISAIVAQLGTGASEVGKAVTLLNSIAEQASIHALNATIEADRAAEENKVFSVVAYELKELAKENARVTEEFSQMIALIQEETQETIKSISELGQVLVKLNKLDEKLLMNWNLKGSYKRI